LGHSDSLGVKGSTDAGVRIYVFIPLGHHDPVLSLLIGCLLGGRGEILKVRLGFMMAAGTVTSLPILAR